MPAYLSFSQISTYLRCGLQYRFKYVDKLEAAWVPANLVFGRAIHESIAALLQSRMEGQPLSQEELDAHFEAEWARANEQEDIAFKKADQQALLEQGKALLRAFCQVPEPDGYTLVAVEEPFSITLVPELPPLIGKIDAVYQRNDDPESALIIDFKTSATALSEFRAAEDHQLTAYAMALEADGYPIEKQSQGFLALIKTKVPKTQTLMTQRTQRQKEQFVKVAEQVTAAVEAGVFIPRKDFTCSDCQFQGACAQW